MQFTGHMIRNDPAYRPRPVSLPGFRRFGDGTLDAFIHEEALQAMVAEAFRRAPHEAIGYLVGRPFRDERGPYVIVAAALAAAAAARGPAHVETTLADEKAAAETIQEQHPTGEKLGWWHSHPFDMPHYSDTDRANQRLWSSEPYQLGMLVCLLGGEATVHAFRGPDAERLQGTCALPARPPRAGVFGPPMLPPSMARPGLFPAVSPTPASRLAGAMAFTGMLVAGMLWPAAFFLAMRDMATATNGPDLSRMRDLDDKVRTITEDLAATRRELVALKSVPPPSTIAERIWQSLVSSLAVPADTSDFLTARDGRTPVAPRSDSAGRLPTERTTGPDKAQSPRRRDEFPFFHP